MKNINVSLDSIRNNIAGLTATCMLILSLATAAAAAETWKETFEDVCSKVDASQTMGIKELETLIERADKLQPEIQRSEDPAKKIYLKRLKNCRSIFEFTIDSKKSTGK
jgi:hypothetical protein